MEGFIPSFYYLPLRLFMPIDRNQLLTEVDMWLPEINVLTDNQILSQGERVISEVGDDDIYYNEVLCKTLKSCGKANQALSYGDPSKGVKRQKSYMREEELHESYDLPQQWEDWLANLPCFCSEVLGYTGLRSKASYGFFANVASPVEVPRGSKPYGKVDTSSKSGVDDASFNT